MANSSDWMAMLSGNAPDAAGRLHDHDPAPEPGWIAALRAPADFVEGVNFAALDALDRPDAAQGARAVPASPAAARAAHTQNVGLGPLEQAFEDGRAQGYTQGYNAGQAKAQAEAQKQAATEQAERTEKDRAVQALRLNLRSLDQAASDALAAELADTVVTLCRHVLADFATDPQILLAHCHEAASRLGTGISQCKLHLNPDDLAAFDPAVLEQWDVVEDDTIARGALRFEGVDGAVSHGPDDWANAIAAAIRG
ncbi:MAG: FliH/SctL family protein [Pseudomonadota bacterium]